MLYIAVGHALSLLALPWVRGIVPNSFIVDLAHLGRQSDLIEAANLWGVTSHLTLTINALPPDNTLWGSMSLAYSALPCPTLPCPALPSPALCYPALPCPALPCPALPCPALHLPCPALHCPALPCPALHCSALPCSALPCPALPCPA